MKNFNSSEVSEPKTSEFERACKAYKKGLLLKIAALFAVLLFVIICVWFFAKFNDKQNALEIALNEKEQAQNALEAALAEKEQLLKKLKLIEILAQNMQFLSQENLLLNENTFQNLSKLADENASLNSLNATLNLLNLAKNSKQNSQNLMGQNSAQSLQNSTLQSLNHNENNERNLNSQALNPQESNVSQAFTPPKIKPKIRYKEINATSLEGDFAQNPEAKTALTLARFYLAKRDYERAALYAFRANELDKSEAQAWLIYAKAKFALGKKDEAKRVLQGFINHYGQDFDENVDYILK